MHCLCPDDCSAGWYLGDLQARENRHIRNILDNTDVRSVASSFRIRIKSHLILFLHIAVCRDNGSLFVTYVTPAEMSCRGGGVQAGQETGALPELQFWSLSAGMPSPGMQECIPSLPPTLVPLQQLDPKRHLPKLQEFKQDQAPAWAVNFCSSSEAHQFT